MRGITYLFTILTFFYWGCNSRQAKPPPLFFSSFEGNSPFEGWTNDQHCCEYSVTQSRDLATDGDHSLRLEVRNSDPETSRSIRAELVQETQIPGSEQWYGMNLLLKDWISDVAGEHVFQWHPDNLTGSATMALWTSSGRYILQSNPGNGEGNTYYDLGPVISDRWTSWVIQVKWDDEPQGMIRVWKNGEIMVDRRNIITTPPEGSYFKLGINKFGWKEQTSTTNSRVLYIDEVRIADSTGTYETVAPRFSQQVNQSSG